MCDNRRIAGHRVFRGRACRGKSSTGGFFGFKLHIVINHLGERLRLKLTAGNRDDRHALKEIAPGLFGNLYADKGYLAQWLTDFLRERKIDLITKRRKNMKPSVRTPFDEALLRQRSVIETVFDELKNLCQIEHTRHRSVFNFLTNLMAGIVAYGLFPYKPRLSVSTVKLLNNQTALIPN